MQTQNLKNHSRLIFMFHGVVVIGLLLVFIGSCVNMCQTCSAGSGYYSATLISALSFITLILAFYARAFSLKAQDRAIRAEENFRHFIATGKPLDSKLTIRQIIGLRFASDEEFVALAQRAIAENLSEKQIKQAIQNWKGDFYRV